MTTLSNEKIVNIAQCVDKGISMYLEKEQSLILGKYESVLESKFILNICIRHIESINLLAKDDLVYLPSAFVLARSAFESSLNVIWLLESEDIFECESRYLTRLQMYEEWLDSQIKFLESCDMPEFNAKEQKESIEKFRLGVLDLLIKKGCKLSKRKNVRDVLKKIGEEKKYLFYKLLSGYIHGDFHSTGIYRKNIGTEMIYGEFIEVNDWIFVYAVVWPIFELASNLYISRATDGEIETVYPESFKKDIQNLLNIN